MSAQSKLTSKLSTLEAARVIYSIIVGLAIKESLGLFAHDWKLNLSYQSITWWPLHHRLIVGIGYLVTVLRFSHGIYLLHGHEQERVKNTTLPSSRRISLLSLFIVLMAIFLYLMANNIAEFRSYIIFTVFILIVDLAYVLTSDVVREPHMRPIKGWRETTDGYPARAAFQWMYSDLLLLFLCGLFFFLKTNIVDWTKTSHEQWFGIILFGAAVGDYVINRSLYFGGKEDKRTGKFVFICSPLSDQDKVKYAENVNKAQYYCYRLIKGIPATRDKDFSTRNKYFTPYAPHCFYPYFLNYEKEEDLIIGRECAIAFLHACDAIYVPVTFEGEWLRRPKLKGPLISPGMEHVIDQAKLLGLEIFHEKPAKGFEDWVRMQSKFREITYESEPADNGITYETSKLRKRVYVCTMLRGTDFDTLESAENVRVCLKKNIRKTLWRCHQLAKEKKDGETKLAPFAPQAFFPYFWDFTHDGLIDMNVESKAWKAWFDRSLEVLKVCDAVYIYTTDGLPQSDKNISRGMKEVLERAKSLGLDIRYRKDADDVPETWDPALPDFKEIKKVKKKIR